MDAGGMNDMENGGEEDEAQPQVSASSAYKILVWNDCFMEDDRFTSGSSFRGKEAEIPRVFRHTGESGFHIR